MKVSVLVAIACVLGVCYLTRADRCYDQDKYDEMDEEFEDFMDECSEDETDEQKIKDCGRKKHMEKHGYGDGKGGVDVSKFQNFIAGIAAEGKQDLIKQIVKECANGKAVIAVAEISNFRKCTGELEKKNNCNDDEEED